MLIALPTLFPSLSSHLFQALRSRILAVIWPSARGQAPCVLGALQRSKGEVLRQLLIMLRRRRKCR
jgi:hypothetical protein